MVRSLLTVGVLGTVPMEMEDPRVTAPLKVLGPVTFRSDPLLSRP